MVTRQRAWCLGLIVVALSLATSCSESSFKSGGGKKAVDPDPTKTPTPPGEPQLLKLPCPTGGGQAQVVTEMSGPMATKVRLEGEFCGISGPVNNAALTVLFILDISGSMEVNDPDTGGTCGRLQAGQAILSKLKATAPPGASLQLGALSFGDGALPTVPITSMAQFEASLTPGIFCSSNGGATNYEASFVTAKSMLSAVVGKKVAYFISDGMPTKSGVGPLGGIGSILSGGDPLAGVHEAGLRAATEFRSQVTDLTINAVFLGNTQLADPSALGAPNPQTYLGQITGDPSRVRVVTSADELASQIVTLDTPEVGRIDEGSVLGRVSASSLGQQALRISSLRKDPVREGVWLFTTEPFELYGQAGVATPNEVVLSVRGQDGKEYTATARILFSVGTL